jgi:2'-5' RNA ligase
MRLFVGLDIPPEVKDNLARFIDSLRPEASLRWSTSSNLHITTKFIGEWRADRLEEMKTALATVQGESFSIAIRGLGWYPNPHSPRVFWAAVRADSSLPTLAKATEEAVATIGVEKEKRWITESGSDPTARGSTGIGRVWPVQGRRVSSLPEPANTTRFRLLQTRNISSY